MSRFQSFHRVAYCNPDKSSDLISCSESVLEVLQECSVAQAAALERLFYLVMSLEGLELKVRRGIIPPRDPVKLDLEFNIKKCFSTINSKIVSKSYTPELNCSVLSWCFKIFAQINENFKLSVPLNKTMRLVSTAMLNHDSKDGFVDKVFDIFTKECSSVNSCAILGKVLSPHPELIPGIMKRCFSAYVSKAPNFSVYKSLMSDLSQYNSNLVSSAVMKLLEQESDINHKLGFVLNVLRSIPALQSISIMLLYESHAFKKLMNSPKESLSSSMIDDLAKLFVHSQVNSYSSVMSLLDQDSPFSLGPILLQKILLNLELAVFGVNDSSDKTISFIENMSSEEDIKMFCKCLTLLPPPTHPYILKCLSIISIYKGNIVTKSIISELMVTQPLEKFESLIDHVKGIYVTVCADCFKVLIKNIKNVSSQNKASDVITFFENADKLKLHNNNDLVAADMASVASVLRDTNNYKLVSLLLLFLDPKPIDITDTIFITSILTDSFIKFITYIKTSDVDVGLLEVIDDLKSNILKWCAINDCVRLSVLRHLLHLVTSDHLFVDESKENLLSENSILESLKSTIIESEEHIHSGRIKKRSKINNSTIIHVLAIQNVMNLIQSMKGNSPKSSKELCTFILEFLCPDCNLCAAWPEEDSMRYTIERDLNVLKLFNKLPILWNIFEEALASKSPDLVVIVRALLIVFISYWSTARVSKCADQIEYCNNTIKLLDSLSVIEWLPLPLLNISQIIPNIGPFEAKLLLLEIWNHFKIHQPHMSGNPSAKCQESLKKTVLSIVQKNIENIGVTAFLFSRWSLIDTT